ncbi:MAG: hypothetical protein AAGC95_10875 [Pseudomonadota bacterium]
MQTLVFSIFIFLAAYLTLEIVLSEMQQRRLGGIFKIRDYAKEVEQKEKSRRPRRRFSALSATGDEGE